jgi:hypothetical protein
MPSRRPSWIRGDLFAVLLASCAILLGLAASAQALLSTHASHRGSQHRSGARPKPAARVVPGAVTFAASRARRADRVLVWNAISLRGCLRAHRAHPRRCDRGRRAVQRAGSNLAGAERRLARAARASARTTQAASARRSRNPRQAPRLSTSGRRLVWTRVARINSYVLVRRVAGLGDQFSVVHGTSVTPPPVPGQTVRYSVRTLAWWSAWAAEQSISYPAAPQPVKAPDPKAAPLIRAFGRTLTWNAMPGVKAYVLVSRAPGRPDQYTEVSGTSVTPPAVPGATVRYSVRTAVEGSAWAPEVAIGYPSTPVPPPPVPPPTPPKSSPAEPGGFQPGLNSGPQLAIDVPGAATLGAKLVRIEFGIGTPAASLAPVIAGYAAKGIRVLPLAGFYGTLPSTPAAQNLAGWASTYGPGGSFWAGRPDGQLAIRSIEFGNETSYGYQYGDGAGSGSYSARAQTYAVRLKQAAQAISATGAKVGLLAQADDWTGHWVDGMYSAVPDLSSYVGGWTIHPYGTGWPTRMKDLIQQTASHGAPASIPIDVTEWGVASDNGKCLNDNYGFNKCMSYQEAGSVLSTYVAAMRQALGGRLRTFMLYQVRDQATSGASGQREAYFGALQQNLQPKGGYTSAVQALLASS